MNHDPWTVTEGEAVTVACPTCNQPAGDRCIPSKFYNYPRPPSGWLSAKTVAALGGHIQHAHRGRRNRVLSAKIWGHRSLETPQLQQIREADRQAHVDEYVRLRTWLAAHANIFRAPKP